MKVIVVLMIVLAVVLGIVYLRGGYQSFDPSAQGNKAKAAIKPGMTWKQVVAVAGPRGKYRHIATRVEHIRGQDVKSTVVGPPVDLDPDRVAARLAANQVPEGFLIQYDFSRSVAFAVAFDSAGIVTDVQDVMTMADLLGTK